MTLTAPIHALQVALVVAKANQSTARMAELAEGLRILRAHESQGTGSAPKATDGGKDSVQKPTLVIQWGGSRELKGGSCTTGR
jgi:hypothetical protein